MKGNIQMCYKVNLLLWRTENLLTSLFWYVNLDFFSRKLNPISRFEYYLFLKFPSKLLRIKFYFRSEIHISEDKRDKSKWHGSCQWIHSGWISGRNLSKKKLYQGETTRINSHGKSYINWFPLWNLSTQYSSQFSCVVRVSVGVRFL